MKRLLLKKTIGKNGRSLTVTLHRHQLEAIGCEYQSDVNVYVDGKKIIIEKMKKDNRK